MKKLFIIGALLISLFANAQELSKEEYEKAVDYVTCVCLNDSEFKTNQIDCNSTFTIENIKTEPTKNLYADLQKLKSANPSNQKQFLTETIFNDPKYEKIYAFAEKRRKEETLANIQQSIAKYFDDLSAPENIQQSEAGEVPATTETIEVQQNGPRDTTTEDTSLYQHSLWDIILGILILGFFFLLNKRSGKIKDVEKKLNRVSAKETGYTAYNDPSSSTARIDVLETEIRKLQREIRNNNAPKSDPPPEIPTIVELQVHPPSQPPPPAEEVFYMATPSGDKLFDDSGRTESFKATQSLYKFTVDNKNKSLAKFVFQSDASGVRECVNYPHKYLEPVCDPQNALNQNAQRITTIQPGVAEKRNDKWVVINKAQIKYE